ncbi:MAG: T9SS type A sorting domain-containing protein, partial [Sphingobacteriaceae bacterium]
IYMSAPIAVTDQFDAQYFYSNPHPTYTNTLKDASLNNISICEYWILNRLIGTSNVSVSLTWDPNSCGVTSLPDLRVARWNGSMWKDQGNGGTGGNTTTGTVVSSGVVTAFSPFTLASSTSANPLPIELLYFTAACNNNIVTFNWATANEINNDYFVIESSLDAINWEIIATKKGAGTSTSEKKYELKVDIISNKPVYYRLKQIDINGSFDYSKLIEVNLCNSDLEDVVIFPNPTTGKLRLMNNSSVSIKSINVYNVMGQKVYMSRTHFEAVDLSEFQDGVYIVNIETEYNNVIKKIIVSK